MSSERTSKQGLSNLRLSYYLSLFLFGGFILVAVVVAATSYMMASEQNRVAAEKTRELIATAIGGVENQLRVLIRDYSNWTAIYDAVRARDYEWIYENSGSSATNEDYLDLNLVVEPGGQANYGWVYNGDEKPQPGLLEAEIMAQMAALLEPTPVNGDSVTHAYATARGEIWLLATTRIVLTDGSAPVADGELARHVFGLRVSDELISGLGDQFLIEGVSLSREPIEGSDNLALNAHEGAPVAYVTWRAPRPGTATLEKISIPLITVMALLALATAMTGRMMVRSATRLERALVMARAADQAKTDFLANISHELRTPMNGVIGVMGILKATDLSEKQQQMVQLVTNSAEAQMRIIEDLVDISRIESGTASLDLVPFRPDEELRNVVDLLRLDADKKDLNFAFQTDIEAIDMVLGDPNAFRQIATNLIGNAIKFTETGQVSVHLDGTTRGDEALLSLSVSDTGPGIAPEHQRLIFERFAQVDSSKSRQKGGSGLGLSISKALVEMIGGTIEVKSSPGQGATFTVRLALELPRQKMNEAA
ncbi:MAG: ATP-binding protein [Paracoccaceae bacterium]|nr:ATP-binding protein [Paracoccaceae bacterium]